MSDFKEFQGKTLDAAIAEACAYYDAPREKLEIDIIEDAKSGIFGLVGARKARIRARRAQFPVLSGRGRPRRAGSSPVDSDAADATVHTAQEKPEKEVPKETAELRADDPGEAAPRRERRGGKTGRNWPAAEESSTENRAKANSPEENSPEAGTPESATAPEAVPPRKPRRGRPPRAAARDAEGKDAENPENAESPAKAGKAEDADGEGGLPRIPLSQLDQERLLHVTTDMVSALIFPIVGEVPLDLDVNDDRVQVRVDCDDTGLLIGREGQNLAAVQYLAARMITHALGAQVRVHVDAGDYHFRQDSRLQELAHSLADKVRTTGRPQSTRPFSAYQRRVIHLALQDDPDVQTCSSGEGALKRVVILPRKD